MGPTFLIPVELGTIALSAANPVYFRPFMPCQVMQVGFIVTVALTPTAAVVTFGITEADTTAADPAGTSVLGTCTATSATMGLNLGVFNNVQETQGRRILYPGEAIIASATTTSTTGTVRAYAVVSYLGMVNVDQRLSTVAAHAGSVQRPLSLSMMTKVIV